MMSVLHFFQTWWAPILAALFAAVAARFYFAIVRLETPKAVLELPADAEYVRDGVRYFRIRVRNTSATVLTNCSLRLESCTSDDGSCLIHTPQGLQRDDGWAPCPLSPGSPKYATFIQLNESAPDSPIQLNCISSLKFEPSYNAFPQYLDRSKLYNITLAICPRETFPHLKKFDVSVRNGRLRCEEAR